MALIGSLFINVKGDTVNFNRNMKKASTTAKVFGQTMKRVAKVGLLFGVGLATVVAGGVLLLTKRAFKAIDATAKLAEQLEISTEALLGYQLAAGLSGTDTETLNKALLRMSKTVGEAK